MRHNMRDDKWVQVWLNPSWRVISITLEQYRLMIRFGRVVLQIGKYKNTY